MTVDEAINELIQCYSLNSKTAKKKNEAISMAIDALEKQRWIPVSVGLPGIGVRVIVELDDGYMTMAERYLSGKWDLWEGAEVIAWKYKPVSYEYYQGGGEQE